MDNVQPGNNFFVAVDETGNLAINKHTVGPEDPTTWTFVVFKKDFDESGDSKFPYTPETAVNECEHRSECIKSGKVIDFNPFAEDGESLYLGCLGHELNSRLRLVRIGSVNNL